MSQPRLEMIIYGLQREMRLWERAVQDHNERISRLELIQLMIIYALGATGVGNAEKIAEVALKLLGK